MAYSMFVTHVVDVQLRYMLYYRGGWLLYYAFTSRHDDATIESTDNHK